MMPWIRAHCPACDRGFREDFPGASRKGCLLAVGRATNRVRQHISHRPWCRPWGEEDIVVLDDQGLRLDLGAFTAASSAAPAAAVDAGAPPNPAGTAALEVGGGSEGAAASRVAEAIDSELAEIVRVRAEESRRLLEAVDAGIRYHLDSKGSSDVMELD